MSKVWTNLLGRPCDDEDVVVGKEIIRPTNYFTLSPFGKRQAIFEIVAKFETEAQASYALEKWKKEVDNEKSNFNFY